MENNLDNLSRKLLAALQADARLSFNALGRQVGLSAPAVAERVRRLEDMGIITGYRVELDRARLGLPITAFIRLTCGGEHYHAVERLAVELPEVLECHRMTGEDTFLLKLAMTEIRDLERLVERFAMYGRTVSSISIATVVDGKPPSPPPLPAKDRA